MMDDNETPDGLEQPDPWLVDRLLDGGGDVDRDDPDGTDGSDGTEGRSAGAAAMASLVNALRQPATEAELSAEESYLAAFDEVVSHQGTGPRPARTVVLGARAAVVAGVAVLAAATGAAAYTGSLPGPLQRAAHQLIGAPAQDAPPDTPQPSGPGTSTPTGTSGETPGATTTSSRGTSVTSSGPSGSSGSSASSGGTGPQASGPAAIGLCTAWAHGGLATTSVAYRNLERAAGGADRIAAYCAPVLTPSSDTTDDGAAPASPLPSSPQADPAKQGRPSPSSHPAPPSHPTHPTHPSHPTPPPKH
jgi:hypothetical protein